MTAWLIFIAMFKSEGKCGLLTGLLNNQKFIIVEVYMYEMGLGIFPLRVVLAYSITRSS